MVIELLRERSGVSDKNKGGRMSRDNDLRCLTWRKIHCHTSQSLTTTFIVLAYARLFRGLPWSNLAVDLVGAQLSATPRHWDIQAGGPNTLSPRGLKLQ